MIRKSAKWFLLCAAALAALLMAFYLFDHFQTSRRIADLKNQLQESTDNWNRINEEKLVLLDELKVQKEILRNAELTLDESEARKKELSGEIETLNREIEELRKNAEVSPSE